MFINLPNGPSIEDVKGAVDRMEGAMVSGSYPFQKIKVHFCKPTEVVVNGCSKKVLEEMDVRFFDSAQGRFCYTFHNRTGFPLHYINVENISMLSIRSQKEIDEVNVKKVKSLRRSIHENAWDDLKQKIDVDPLYYASNFGLERISIKQKLKGREDTLDRIKEAFDNKEEFRYRLPGTLRDMSVEMKVCEDGIYRAWFSSEFAGCGNGSYYLLLNPKTASFREDD